MNPRFVKKELHNTYDELIFFVISSRPLPRIIHSDKVTVFLWNVERLLPYLDTNHDAVTLEKIAVYLQQNLCSSVGDKYTLWPKPAAGGRLPRGCDGFLKFLDLYGKPEAPDVIAGVGKLYTVLCRLTSGELSFIYYMLSFGNDAERGTGYAGEHTFVPESTLVHRLNGRETLVGLYFSLQAMGFVSYIEDYQPVPEGRYVPVFSSHFYCPNTEIELLTSIRKFCQEDDSKLRSIILDKDFTSLG